MSDDSRKYQLELNRADELFAEPEADPFDPNTRFQSGIDELIAQLRLHPRELGHTSHIGIRLPASEINADTKASIRAALERYCVANIELNRQIIADLRVSSGWYTISAILVSLALILFAGALVNVMPSQYGGAIAGLVGIAIWVILWDPIYNYFYAWRPNRRDIRVLENLRNCELTLEESQVPPQ